LLYSILAEDDPQRKEAMAAVGASEARLRQAVKHQLISQQSGGYADGDCPNPQWN
jgi:hypothetical protein